MRLLEYQAKELFKEFGIKTPPSISSKDIEKGRKDAKELGYPCLLYTSPSPRDRSLSRMPSSA